MTLRFRLPVLALLTGLFLAGNADAAKKGAITKLSVDPKAPVVQLFDGMEKGQLETKLIQKNSKTGNLLVENLTDETITVEMPDAFVGVHVLNQGFGGGGGGGGLGGGGGGQQGGGGQSTGGGGGGGRNGGGLGGGQQGGGGGGFFSIPAKKMVRLTVNSVCLEHGKPEPTSRMEYKIYPVSDATEDPVLHELLVAVARGQVNQRVAQAAAWHLANKMSWQELASLEFRRLAGLPPVPQFSRLELTYAQTAVASA